jgi:tetratricopeptide (TPR) repeat protein
VTFPGFSSPPWGLLREQSGRGTRARRRAAVLGASTVFVGGLLVAVGLASIVVVVALALVALAAAVVGTTVSRRPVLWTRLGLIVRRAAKARSTVARGLSQPVAGSVRRVAAVRPTLTGEWGGWPYAGARDADGFAEDAARRRALGLNAEGTNLRRQGAFEEAVDRHRAALEIFRDLGDRRTEAVTLNNMALALERAGDEDGAVERFEEALAILREVRDHEHEGRVIANLGFTLHRHGHPEQARELLVAALEKLDPGSRAARRVEEELRRAS